MIIVHVYCSYKSSPIGFAYGTFEFMPDNDDANYYLSNANKNQFVLSSFEDGKIRRASGKCPGSSKYLFLVRKLKYDYGLSHTDFGRDVDMNFAFEFDSYDEYRRFSTNFLNFEKQESSSLYKALADSIIPDNEIETYKLSINKERFDKFIEKLTVDNNCNESRDLKSKIKITTASTSYDYTKDIIEIYQLPLENQAGELLEVKREADTAYYYYPVKKKQHNRLILPIVIISVILLIILMVAFANRFSGGVGITTKNRVKICKNSNVYTLKIINENKLVINEDDFSIVSMSQHYNGNIYRK